MKKLVAAALAGVMVLSMAACGAEDFDAKGYVQGALDAQFKGDTQRTQKTSDRQKKKSRSRLRMRI